MSEGEVKARCREGKGETKGDVKRGGGVKER